MGESSPEMAGYKEITRTLLDLNERQLDETLQRFYAEVRKEVGLEYKLESLRVMFTSLDCHFRENGTPTRQGFCV